MSSLFADDNSLCKLIVDYNNFNLVFNSISSSNGLPKFTESVFFGIYYDNVKAILTMCYNTVFTISSPTIKFASSSHVTDDAEGTLQSLLESCTSKGWTIANLTINSIK